MSESVVNLALVASVCIPLVAALGILYFRLGRKDD